MDFNKTKINYDDLIWGDKFSNCSFDNYKFYKIDELYERSSFDNSRVFISHNGDLAASPNIWDKISQYTDMWYSTNVTFIHDNVKPIPIGLENDYVNNSVYKKNCLYEEMKNINQPTKLLYVNHNIGTNPIERAPAYSIFQNNREITIDPHTNSMPIDSYYSKIKDHFFVFSPPGNGIDAHRSWEILYLGRIPIIKDIYHADLFSDLPVVKYTDYSQITEEFLNAERNRIIKNYHNYNFNKLKISYWIDTIKKHL